MRSVENNVNSTASHEQMLNILCDTAKKGLMNYYRNPSETLPYTTGLKDLSQWILSGESLRYAAITHIGVSKWLKFRPDDKEQLPILWKEIRIRSKNSQNIGDVALSLWSGAEGEADEGVPEVADRLLELWPKQKQYCNSVELGWVLKACLTVTEMMPGSSHKLDLILKESYARLSDNYNQTAQLFRRHKRKGFKQKVSGQIACFADQVYPIVAMAHYGKVYNDKDTK